MTLSFQSNRSLRTLNTLGVDVSAQCYAEASAAADVQAALSEARRRGLPLTVLGGGSNVVFTGDVDGLVLRMANRGIQVLEDGAERTIVEAQAGEPWHPFVLHTLASGLGGLENLSLIPGTVGAAPVQNIGAYGVELRDVFAGLTAIDRLSGETVVLSGAECAFDYRDSCFKREPERWVILSVRFALSRTRQPNTEYRPVRERLEQMGLSAPSAADVGRIICAIRSEKLPDPAVLPNAGSFFKNPLVTAEQWASLRVDHPDLVAYPQGDGRVKLAAGWLIEKAGWKGYREGAVGVHGLQALVLVNPEGGSGGDILHLAARIQRDVLARFGVVLEIEPVVL